MSTKRSDRPDVVAEWGFTERPEVMDMLKRQARNGAGAWGMDVDDVLQEMYLWLAVRPHLHDLPPEFIHQHVRSIIQTEGNASRRREGHEESLDALQNREE